MIVVRAACFFNLRDGQYQLFLGRCDIRLESIQRIDCIPVLIENVWVSICRKDNLVTSQRGTADTTTYAYCFHFLIDGILHACGGEG